MVSGLFPQLAFAQQEEPSFWDSFVDFGTDILLAPLGWVAILLLQIANLILFFAGNILDLVIEFTVINFSTNISGSGLINDTWGVIRNLANMTFIFILLYAAIQTILGVGTDAKKLVMRVIIIAILINFSLFFTKLVIDTSNVLAIAFYDAVATGTSEGISDRMMDELELSTLWDTEGIGAFSGKKLIIVGIMGSIVVMIATFVFFAISIMLIVRFVVLMFLLIFSPIAFMAFVLPALKKYGDQWKDALIGQAFFAPIYLMLTWVVIRISDGLFGNQTGNLSEAFLGTQVGGGNERLVPGEIGIVMNFMIIIALLIASLVIAKSWSNKAGSGVAGITKWATGTAGSMAFGTVGRIGRNSLGSRAATMASDEGRIKRASEGNIRARLELAAAGKLSKSSFDVRGTPLGGTLDAGRVKKGANFIDEQKARAKTYEKYKPSSSLIKSAQTRETETKDVLEKARAKLEGEATTIIPRPEGLIRAERELKDAREAATELSRPLDINTVIPSEAEMATRRAKSEAAINLAQERVSEEKKKYEQTRTQFIDTKTGTERATYEQARKDKDEILNRMDNMAKRMEKQRTVFGVPLPSGIVVNRQDRANAIRAAAKSKPVDKEIADLLKKKQDEEVPPEEPKPQSEASGESKPS